MYARLPKLTYILCYINQEIRDNIRIKRIKWRRFYIK